MDTIIDGSRGGDEGAPTYRRENGERVYSIVATDRGRGERALDGGTGRDGLGKNVLESTDKGGELTGKNGTVGTRHGSLGNGRAREGSIIVIIL